MTTGRNDLVLVHVDDKPGFYARIEAVVPDVKPNWWQVKLLVLTFPLQVYTWILDSEQVAGAPFTMGGTPIRLEKLASPLPGEEAPEETPPEPPPAGKGGGKVVSLLERKKGKGD